jgi:hypothetical protein
MSKRDKSYYKKISGVLSGVVNHQGWDRKLDMHSVFLKWEELVGDTLAECTRPHKIVNNVLWIEVETSSWMQQLQFEKIPLLEKLNDSLYLSTFNDIKFILPEKKEKKVERDEPKIRFVAPDDEELKAFEDQVSLIEDVESREALVRLWYLSKACRKE